MPTEKHAVLSVKGSPAGHTPDDPHWVSFRAANGESLGHSENHPTEAGALRARGDWIAAMIDVLQQEGYTVNLPLPKPDEGGIGDE